MAKGIRYTEEFKRDAITQVVERGYSAAEVARRLGVSTKSLYDWIKRYGAAEPTHQQEAEQSKEIRRLKAELLRVTEERDILKKTTAYFAKEAKKYAFIKIHRLLFSVKAMCRVLKVHRSGF